MSLSDADLESIRELFLNFDSNSDGTISNRELQHFINSIQGKPDEWIFNGCNAIIATDKDWKLVPVSDW